MASPTYFSTVPPCRAIVREISAKALPSSCLSRSAPNVIVSSVDPTTSTNMHVTRRRSSRTPLVMAPSLGRARGALLDDRRLALARHRPVRHIRARPRAVPVRLAGGDVRDVADRDLVPLLARRDDAQALGDDEDLIRGVHVQLRARAALERHLDEPQIAAPLVDHGLCLDVADEDAVRWEIAARRCGIALGARSTTRGADLHDTHAPILGRSVRPRYS